MAQLVGVRVPVMFHVKRPVRQRPGYVRSSTPEGLGGLACAVLQLLPNRAGE